MRVLGVVTARGGSKGIPRKNVRSLAGKPLIAWTAEAALGARRLARTILSTEDAEIARVGRAAGLEVPFVRPAELAQDQTPTLPVLRHAVTTLEAEGDRYDAICLLQPTHPLRTSGMIDDCIERFEAMAPDSLISVSTVPPEYNPHWVYFVSADGVLRLSTGEETPIARRQELPPAYHREGSIYLMKRDVLIEQGTLYGQRLVGYPLDPSQSVNIDTEADWARAESMLMR